MRLRDFEKDELTMQLLKLDWRLGEGTDAGLAMSRVGASVRGLTDVATLNEAGVSEADEH